jgi:hypothetical protein
MKYEIHTVPSIFTSVDPEVWDRITKRFDEHNADIEALIGAELAVEFRRREDLAFLHGTLD